MTLEQRAQRYIIQAGRKWADHWEEGVLPVIDKSARRLAVNLGHVHAVTHLTTYLWYNAYTNNKAERLLGEIAAVGFSRRIVKAAGLACRGMRARRPTNPVIPEIKKDPLARVVVLGHLEYWFDNLLDEADRAGYKAIIAELS